MPKQNDKIISKYQGEANPDKRYLKLGRKITDVAAHKIMGITSNDPEYWGLREVLTPEMCDVCNKMKLRKFYTLDQLIKMNPEVEPAHLQELMEKMSYIGVIEYDYGDNYDHYRELKDKPRIKRYRLPFYVPGSAELFNSTVDRIEKNPAVASFFERMTFIPLAGITQMVPPGGDGIGMHVIPVEAAINAENTSVDLEHISYWLQKYEGHISAGICSCRASRAVLGDGCADDVDDWCIQLGDMADYTVETGRAHYITKERALEILELAEKNGFVHQITNIDGSEKIFDICNCDVKICNALRTSLLFNTPNLSRQRDDLSPRAAAGQDPLGRVRLGRGLPGHRPDAQHLRVRLRPLQGRLPRPCAGTGLSEAGPGRQVQREPGHDQDRESLPRGVRPGVQQALRGRLHPGPDRQARVHRRGEEIRGRLGAEGGEPLRPREGDPLRPRRVSGEDRHYRRRPGGPLRRLLPGVHGLSPHRV